MKQKLQLYTNAATKKLLFVAVFFFGLHASAQGTFDGFETLKIPRGNMPLGAEWINKVGPHGAGTAADNISISSSLSNFVMDQSFKEKLDLAIINYLDIGSEYKSDLSISYKNLSIYTVTDLTKITIRNGQYILYEAIRADSIVISLQKEVGADVRMKLNDKVKNLKITSSTDLSKGVSFSGEELFMAYRVFKLGSTKISKKEKVLSGPSMWQSSIVETKVQDYFLSFNHASLLECMYPAGATKTNDKLLECSKQFLVQVAVKNYRSQNMQGQPLAKNFAIMSSSKTTFVMSNRLKNKIVSDNFEIYYYMQPAAIMGQMALDKENSKVRIIRASTKIKMLRNPKAPGW